jgi:acyl-CoA synthetase (AMP-forming)/AMP-acid ligase II
MGNLAEILTLAARRFPDRAAIKLDATELSYRELDEAASAVADLVRARGIRPGDRVGLMLPNVPDFPIVYYGILRAGGVAVPMNVMLKEREAEFYLAAGARCRLQVPALRLGRRRTAEGPDGKDPEASDLDPGAARRGGCRARVISRNAPSER